MYAIYEDFMEKEKFACQKYCAHCCTRNVTITTLEGYNIPKRATPATQQL
jgi:hypothetical protein